MAINRLIVAIAIAGIGSIAPARAWCEATCLAPAATGQSHCPSLDPVDGTTTISASVTDECPVIESARPTIPARLNMQAVTVITQIPEVATRTYASLSSVRPHSAITVFERGTPLRI